MDYSVIDYSPTLFAEAVLMRIAALAVIGHLSGFGRGLPVCPGALEWRPPVVVSQLSL